MPPIFQNNIWLVVPAYNEEEKLEQVLSDLVNLPYSIVVVNDGSQDKTAAIVRRFPSINLLNHRLNRGMGAALQTGDEYARQQGAEYIVHFDSDGQMRAADIEPMLAPLLAGQADITLGTRFANSQSQLPWFKKYILLQIGRCINWLFTGLWLSDAHNGWRAFNKKVLDNLTIQQDAMAHNTEIVRAITRHHWAFQEVPVTIVYHEFGQGLLGGIRIVRDLIFKRS
ncbi:MAG: glycosyltransferase family 2 protein [Candidatus Komeilibacteria bacterium]